MQHQDFINPETPRRNTSSFSLIAGYVAITAVIAKLIIMFLEVFFNEFIKLKKPFKFLEDARFNEIFPTLFNIGCLLCFLILILRYYTGDNIKITKDKLNFNEGNIIPYKNEQTNINIERINAVCKEFMFYTSLYVILLLIYYSIDFSFEELVLRDDRKLSSNNYVLLKVFSALRVSIQDAANLISNIPLFMCFRLLFYNSFKKDKVDDSVLKAERRIFYALIYIFSIFAFIEFAYLATCDIEYFDEIRMGNKDTHITTVEILQHELAKHPVIINYKFTIGLLAGLAMGLLFGRIMAMDYIFDFKFPNNRFVNSMLNILIKLLPVYAIIQPFYGFFVFAAEVETLKPLESFTYFFSGVGKLIYLIFIIYLLDSKELQKFIYLSMAMKDTTNYKIHIQRKS